MYMMDTVAHYFSAFTIDNPYILHVIVCVLDNPYHIFREDWCLDYPWIQMNGFGYVLYMYLQDNFVLMVEWNVD